MSEVLVSLCERRSWVSRVFFEGEWYHKPPFFVFTSEEILLFYGSMIYDISKIYLPTS